LRSNMSGKGHKRPEYSMCFALGRNSDLVVTIGHSIATKLSEYDADLAAHLLPPSRRPTAA